MYEFDTSFVVDTGSLNQSFTGSGVHLNKDVTFSFSLIDHQGNTVQSDQQLINNPLINTLVFDILDSSGNVVYPNYLSGGTSRTITISEINNQSIFGQYTKDFGVMLKVSNNLDNQIFTGAFFAYGNTPVISNYTVADGSISYYSSTEQIFGEISVDLQIGNDLKYIKFERYDIYASTEADDIDLYQNDYLNPRQNETYLYSQYTQNLTDILNIKIKPLGLNYNTPYYFTIVPYSTLGSGEAISFGPKIFSLEATGSALTIVSSNQFELFYGDESMNLGFITGSIYSDTDSVIDSIESGMYHTLLYTAQIESGVDRITSSELKLSLDSTGATILESPINNYGQLIYSVSQSGFMYNLSVSGAPVDSTFKLFKTLI